MQLLAASITFLLLCLCLHAEQVDAITYGKEAFTSLGCAECHTVKKGDPAVKTGPALYGVFQKNARKRDIIAAGENHRLTVKADLDYFLKSIRDPHSELAIAESGPTKGETYLPIMPPYDQKVLSDFKAKAIFHYLSTLNDPTRRGPAMLMMENADQKTILTPETDPAEIIVTNKTRIYRGRLAGNSARAVFVGTPDGLNYSFDPRVMSITNVWRGGFLNLYEEMKGRATKPSRFGEKATPIFSKGQPLLQPLDQSGTPIDLSFKSPLHRDFGTMLKHQRDRRSATEILSAQKARFRGYTHAETPIFHFDCDGNQLTLTFTTSLDGTASITVDGTLSQPQSFALSKALGLPTENWTVAETPATLRFSLPGFSGPAWKSTLGPINRAPQKAHTRPLDFVSAPPGYSAVGIQPPLDPYGREQLFEPMGIDFSKDGTCVISTRTAGVWTLKDGEWRQIAEGLIDALGLVIEKDDLSQIVIGQKPELTRLIDTNGDGWMDRYKTLSDDFFHSTNYHEYLHGPTRGADGNYYISTNTCHEWGMNKEHAAVNYKAGGQYMSTLGLLRGWSLQVTPDGQLTPFATGLRSPAGLATGPDGQLYYTDNQGSFFGTSELHILREGKFYGAPHGLVDLPGKDPGDKEILWASVKDTREPVVALLPHAEISNSPGSPTWYENQGNGAFGPFSGQMFLGDQTLSTLFRVLTLEHGDAAVVPFAQDFPSGVMRLAFAPDGSLYVGQTGRGWRAAGGNVHALVRLSRNEAPPAAQLVAVRHDGEADFHFTFDQPLGKPPEALSCQSWYFQDSEKYGSPKHDRREENVSQITLSEDKKTITLKLKSVQQPKRQRIYRFSSKDLPPNRHDRFEVFFTRSPRS